MQFGMEMVTITLYLVVQMIFVFIIIQIREVTIIVIQEEHINHQMDYKKTQKKQKNIQLEVSNLKSQTLKFTHSNNEQEKVKE